MENVDWAALPFNYHKTDYNVRISYKDGKWGEPELTQDEYISVHMSAPCLHYGVESFEGLKAFRGADGKVRLFRPDENGKRFEYKITGSQEANPMEFKLSDDSPFGRAVVGKAAGETFTVNAPAGSFTMKVVSVSREG